MKHIGLVGLSVATAAIIMGGCGDSGSSSSAPKTPAGVSTPVAEINVSTVQNMFAYLNGSSPLAASATPNSKAIAKMLDAKAKMEAKVASLVTVNSGGDYTDSRTYDCSISGTWSYTYSQSWTNDPDGGWTNSFSYDEKYNNCIDDATGQTVNGEPVNRYVRNGTMAYSSDESFNTDSNLTKATWKGSDNQSRGYENNETTTSQIYTYNNSWKETFKADGNYWDSAAQPSIEDTYHTAGNDKRVDTNSSGSVIGGWRDKYDETWTYNALQDNSYMKEVGNGYYAEYDTNASGVETLTWSEYFKNFVVEGTTSGAENNVTVSGTFGDTCLGGTLSLKTNPIVQMNQTDYFDGDGSTGGNVLPYAGGLSVSGKATVGFDANGSNYTTALVIAQDGNQTFSRFSDLAVGPCGGI